MFKLDRVLALATPLFLCGACGAADAPEEDAELGEAASASQSGNGVSLNGVSLNGVSLNGVSLNGVSLNGVSLNGVSLNGTSLSGGGYSGTQFITAKLQATYTNGTPVEVRIEDIVQSSDPDILLYNVAYKTASGTWEPICGYSTSGDVRAGIPLSGRWDYSSGTATGGAWIDDATQFTLACVGSALGKCAQLGYKPWKTVQECDGQTCQTLSLRSFHQACSRMVRADHCGDGASHTEDGVSINLWDNPGVQTQATVPPTWLNDSEWTPDGAACIANYRYNPRNVTSDYVAAHCPTRASASYGCFSSGSTFFTASGYATALSSRSLIRNQFDPASVP